MPPHSVTPVDPPGADAGAQPDLRDAMLATSRAILSKQLRTERELHEVRESLRRHNEELVSANAILSATLDASPVGVIACSLQGRVARTNPRLDEIFPGDGAVAAGHALPDVARLLGERLSSAHDFRLWLDQVMAAPDRLHAIDLTAPGGRQLHCKAVPQMAGPDCVGVVLNWADMTEHVASLRLQAEAEAAGLANRAKSAFMSRASHELRTPLNAVVGFSQLLALNETIKADQSAVRQIALIHAAGNHLTALVDDLLQLSRVETGELALVDELVDLAACAREAVELVELMAQERQVALSAVPARAVWVRGDRTRVRQVLLNLVTNAVKYNRPGGTVEVEVLRREATGRVEIRDTGLGLSAEQQAHLFEPFNRLGAEKLRVEGTGLGLAITRHLLLAMKGDIGVDSQAGVGSVFTASLPLAAAVH